MSAKHVDNKAISDELDNDDQEEIQSTISDEPKRTRRLKKIVDDNSNESPVPAAKYGLRKIVKKTYSDLHNTLVEDNNDADFQLEPVKKQQRQRRKQSESDQGETLEYTKLPNGKLALKKLLQKTQAKIESYKLQWFQEQGELENKISQVAPTSIPICADVRNFDFQKLADEQKKHGGRLFDVIMMDPPWQLSSSQPSRGVAIAYQQLADDLILKLPIEKIQTEGFIFIWVINAKYSIAAKLMKQWGYTLVDELAWIKRTVNGKIAKGHGFYLQHAKESCLIGVKGDDAKKKYNQNVAHDILWSERRGQSQKPEEIYDLIDNLVPNGYYLEIFGRRNNIRKNWVTVGNEL